MMQPLLWHNFPRRGVVLLLIAALFMLVPQTANAAAAPSSEASKQAVVAVKGLACPFCVYGLKKHLSALPGVKKVEVTLGKGEAVIDFAPSAKVSDADIQKAIRKAGFTAGKIEWSRGENAGASPPSQEQTL